MEIKITEMVSKVVKLLDENEEIIIDKTEFGYPGCCLTDLIADLLPDIAESTVREADSKDIDEWLEADADFEWISPGMGEMELPEDFLRLTVFRMSDWKSSVKTAVSSDSPVYSLRRDSRSSRKNIRKAPMVALKEGERRRKLEFIGSFDPGAYVERAGYVPLPQRDDSDTLWIPRSLIHRVACDTAVRIRAIITYSKELA